MMNTPGDCRRTLQEDHPLTWIIRERLAGTYDRVLVPVPAAWNGAAAFKDVITDNV